MKKHLLLIFLFYSIAYPQSDEIKLWKQNKPLYGKVIIIKPSVIEFKQDSTGFLYEFKNEEINYIKSASGDTLWFKNPINKINNSEINNNIDVHSISDSNKIITLFFSYNFSGIHKSSLDTASSSLDVNAGISLGAEVDILKIAKESVKLGLGVMYQFPREKERVNGDFNFIPLFAFIKLGLINNFKVKLYVVPSFGYNFFNSDDKYSKGLDFSGGFYNSIGFGLIIKNNLDLKIIYQFNRITAKNGGNNEVHVIYKTFNLNFGYYF